MHIFDMFRLWKKKRKDGEREKERETYQASQMLTPATRVPPLVKVSQQQYESYKHSHEAAGTENPPCPPQRLPALEEADRLFGKRGNLVFTLLGRRSQGLRVDGRIWGFIHPRARTKTLWGMDDANAQYKAHAKTTNV